MCNIKLFNLGSKYGYGHRYGYDIYDIENDDNYNMEDSDDEPDIDDKNKIVYYTNILLYYMFAVILFVILFLWYNF